jgi:hypothetical protein
MSTGGPFPEKGTSHIRALDGRQSPLTPLSLPGSASKVGCLQRTFQALPISTRCELSSQARAIYSAVDEAFRSPFPLT